MKRLHLLSIALVASLYAQSGDQLVKEIMRLRNEVETLSSTIQEKHEATKATMRSLVMQKNELEANIGRQELKIKQLQNEIAKLKAEIERRSQTSKELKPLVLHASNTLMAHIDKEIPFKTKERKADIQKIITNLNAKLLTPQKALAQIWGSYSDAVRLTKENGLFKQTIKIDGKDRLAEVAKVGMMMLYFQLPDETVGYAKRTTNGWSYTKVESKEQKKMIAHLFDSMHKQIRTGFFTLPNAIDPSKVEK